MTLVVNRAYIEEANRTAERFEVSLRNRFRIAYGSDGDRRADDMITLMRQNADSDSEDPGEVVAGPAAVPAKVGGR